MSTILPLFNKFLWDYSYIYYTYTRNVSVTWSEVLLNVRSEVKYFKRSSVQFQVISLVKCAKLTSKTACVHWDIWRRHCQLYDSRKSDPKTAITKGLILKSWVNEWVLLRLQFYIDIARDLLALTLNYDDVEHLF